MALVHCDFFSEVLGLSTSMCVILPENTGRTDEQRPLPERHRTLWLLHGLSDDHTIWQRRTSIERYAKALDLAVVMPAVGRSFYTDMVHGLPYWTFISEELPRIARSFFPLSDAREDNFVAGLSMGGYGAYKLALRHPERYCAAASLSGVLDLAGYLERNENDHAADFNNIFGAPENFPDSENDLLHLATLLAKSDKPRPALYQCCGTEDFLYDTNITFRDHAKSLSLELTHEEGPGDHEWGFWDQWIQRVLEWLSLK